MSSLAAPVDRVRDPLSPRAIDLPTEVPLDPDADLAQLDDAKILAAPDDPELWPAWRAALDRWREDAHRRHRYTGRLYELAADAWTATCYSVALLWLWDERLYDHETGEFTARSFLDAAHEDFGGFDAVVLWHAFPVIGIDPRNQFDYYRSVPGLTELIDELHSHGVRVFLDYNPWDVGTRREPHSDAVEVAELARELRVDGVFLDTLKQGEPELVAALHAVSPALALEGESRLALAGVEDHALSWAQWFADSRAPGVLRAHLYERRHMMHHIRRWNRDHSEELQSAWVNGAGILVWENVFGAWVGWNDRDRSTLRTMLLVQRALSDHFVRGGWTPLADPAEEAVADGVYGSRFDHRGSSVWTLVNRAHTTFEGDAVVTENGAAEGRSPDTWFDLSTGERLGGVSWAGRTRVTVRVPARGVAAVLRVTPGAEPPGLAELLTAAAAERRRSSTNIRFPERRTRRIEVVPAPVSEVPTGMAAVRPGRRELVLIHRRRETGLYDGAPYVEEWKPLPPRLHDARRVIRTVSLTPIAVQRLEVSNTEYLEFVRATGYRPIVGHRFLRHWVDGAPVAGTEDEPVTYVDLADARAYAAWRGARLPTEGEWHAAAQDEVLERRQPLVWNWTESEHTDGRTRFVMIKGGSWFRAQGSDWYLDGGPQPAEVTVKLLLLGAGLARSECIGFRCAADLDTGTGTGGVR